MPVLLEIDDDSGLQVCEAVLPLHLQSRLERLFYRMDVLSGFQ